MKIISMSVYGDNIRYQIGAKRQIELARKYYPGWKVRLYVDNKDIFKDFKNEIEIIEKKDKTNGMFWRFEPMFESQDNIVIVRDADSRTTIREARAVDEWLNSSYKFHNFKDHDAQYEFPIIGNSFGFKGKFDNNLLFIMKNIAENNLLYLHDQIFLQQFIFPLVKDDTFYHDKDREGWFGDTRKKLINKYDFCGQGYFEDDMPIYKDIWTREDMSVPKLKENKFSEGIMFE